MQGENRRKVCRLRNGSGSPDLRRFVKRGVEGVEILGIQLVGDNAEALANTINMKWITKEPPTLFFNEILTNSQLFCAFIKVPLQLYVFYGVVSLVLEIRLVILYNEYRDGH